ncbi:MAG TPA: M1 family aminopeptidase [Gemmatimonadales bacterium]|nr:M1 family aminopeptidase [Gemmatimonadales bacterium]
MNRPHSALFAVLALAPALSGQQVTGSPATAYLARYHELVDAAPSGQVMKVHKLVLARDAGTLILGDGSLYLMANVGGRTVGAVYQGTGHFTFVPGLPTERAEMTRVTGTDSLDDSVSSAAFIFSDSTTDQLLHFGTTAGQVPGSVADDFRNLCKSLEGKNEGSLDPGVMEPVLNGEQNGLFLTRLKLVRTGDWLYEVDPAEIEGAQLYRPAKRTEFGAHWDLVTQGPLRTASPDTSGSWDYVQAMDLSAYTIDVTLHQTFTADLDFSAHATTTLHAVTPVGPWVRLQLHWKILVDSARWSDGSNATPFKAKDDEAVWVRAPHRLNPGDSVSLTLHYHADHPDLIDRDLEWFFLDPGADWYPVNGEGRQLATFDVTFHYPFQYPLASVGDRTDSSRADKIVTTRWVLRRPSDFATFTLGNFDDSRVQKPGEPALDVMISDAAHDELVKKYRDAGYYLPRQSHMREVVAQDVGNSLKFYTYLFGPPPYSRFYITEIPYGEGVSFPGLIDLSMSTFQFSQLDGFDEWFRAHEVAHQWWGNGVNQASYRDKWLTEGLASFSALWYLAAERKGTSEYFNFLDKYKDDIMGEKDDVGPIWVGYRSSTFKVPWGYQTMVYEKGAWIFHMLRIMMLDTRTMNEDRFTQTMKDYYQTFQGKAASTADFQSVVERHAGLPMDWFFDEWVKETKIPTYHVAWTNQAGDNNTTVIKFRISQDNVGPDFQMPVLVTADLGENRTARFRIMVRGGKTDYQSPALPAGAKKLVFNDLHSTLANVKMESW